MQALVAELGLGQHVRFVDEYVSLPALGRWLQAADVFVTPYPGAEQAVSGTLAYALGTGKALVSTPYAYALELLAEGRGRLAPFGDSAALGREIGRFLTDRAARDEARRRAYAYGRRMTWERVGAAYRELFAEVAADRAAERAGQRGDRPAGPPASRPGRARGPRPPTVRRPPGERRPLADGVRNRLLPIGPNRPRPDPWPEVVRTHLDELTGRYGIYQHARGRTPDPGQGYCTDDVARAAIVDSSMAARSAGRASPTRWRGASTSWSRPTFRPPAGCATSGTIDGNWLEDQGSADAHARGVQALGMIVGEGIPGTIA